MAGGHIAVIAATELAPLAQIDGAHDRDVSSLAFSSDGLWLASGGQDGKVIIWDSAARRKLASFRPRTPPSPRWPSNPTGRVWLRPAEQRKSPCGTSARCGKSWGPSASIGRPADPWTAGRWIAPWKALGFPVAATDHGSLASRRSAGARPDPPRRRRPRGPVPRCQANPRDGEGRDVGSLSCRHVRALGGSRRPHRGSGPRRAGTVDRRDQSLLACRGQGGDHASGHQHGHANRRGPRKRESRRFGARLS